jgi:hypothetical protein
VDEVKAFVEGALKLTISVEKSRLAALEDGVEFLGYGVRSRREDKRLKCVVGRAEDRVVHAVKRTIAHQYICPFRPSASGPLRRNEAMEPMTLARTTFGRDSRSWHSRTPRSSRSWFCRKYF